MWLALQVHLITAQLRRFSTDYVLEYFSSLRRITFWPKNRFEKCLFLAQVTLGNSSQNFVVHIFVANVLHCIQFYLKRNRGCRSQNILIKLSNKFKLFFVKIFSFYFLWLRSNILSLKRLVIFAIQQLEESFPTSQISRTDASKIKEQS